ncbi:hypothetical protein EKO29_13750 [Colwellia sp. Arc7-635]|uniref:hypothetical protein n=1 Tax=Colwellia sp. Arc7-635 TaxID=2497879 RepID=UPI000F8545FE|nr:hypothetical protein [Colwellia sp. Arc7-635]AZQ84957.1 hypothetical protein EKO29_13750 [Colwellia sp. Arc7-635]
MKRKRIGSLSTALSYFIVMFFLSYGYVHAQAYTVGVEDISYFPIYDFSEDTQNRHSFTKELLRTFFDLHGYQFKFVALPLKRFDKWYAEEAIDFKFPDNARWRTEQSKKLNIKYSQAVLNLTAGSYVLKKNKNNEKKKIKRLGTIFGFHPTLWHKSIKNNKIELVGSSSPFSLIKHLLHGNIDAIYIDKNVIDYNLKRLNKKSDAVVLNKNINHEPFSFHFSTISHPEIIQQFNDFLQSHHQIISTMKKKYGIVETPVSL